MDTVQDILESIPSNRMLVWRMVLLSFHSMSGNILIAVQVEDIQDFRKLLCCHEEGFKVGGGERGYWPAFEYPVNLLSAIGREAIHLFQQEVAVGVWLELLWFGKDNLDPVQEHLLQTREFLSVPPTPS